MLPDALIRRFNFRYAGQDYYEIFGNAIVTVEKRKKLPVPAKETIA